MMTRLFLLLFALAGSPAFAQTTAPPPADPLPPLIGQREALVRQYEAANAQRNSLFGNKASKKDLEEVVATLKGIIRQDTEIVEAVKAAALRQTAAVVAENQQAHRQVSVATTDQTTTRQRFYDLQSQVANLQERNRQSARKLAAAQARAAEADQARTTRDGLAAGLAVLSAGLLAYVVRLRGQRRPTGRRKR